VASGQQEAEHDRHGHRGMGGPERVALLERREIEFARLHRRMGIQSLTIALVVARAVNILG
jgi:hypothetical protein